MSMRAIVRLKGLVAVAAVLVAAPALAQSANFGSLTLTSGFSNSAGEVQGYTQGSVSLASIANRDQAGNLCLGFADSTPDHIMVLQQDFASLNVQVDSQGRDTTLLIQGPGNTIRCGDDTGSNTDASIRDSDWGSGEYRVWVGSFDANTRMDYTLRVRE